jgi:hypothetical protein
MLSFYNFIAGQLSGKDEQVTIDSDFISFKINDEIYKEPLFKIDESFSKEDLSSLYKIYSNILVGKSIEEYDDEIRHMKWWYLISHEKYFNENKQFDHFDRDCFSNLIDEFKEILSVPILDILRNYFRQKFKILSNRETKVYFTCDFDILNIWDNWTFKTLISELLRSVKRLEFKTFLFLPFTYSFSRIFRRANSFLNFNMFSFSKEHENIGFFISDTSSSKYDGVINYKNKVVQGYIQDLKRKGVRFGLHTNFGTRDNPKSIFLQEKKFKKIFRVSPKTNRHHYLRFDFLHFLRTLEMIGVKEDFSIYFAESLCFRCGLSSRFQIWDIINNKPFNVVLVPTTLMDVTFSYYLKVSFNEAEVMCKRKIDLVFEHGDSLVLLWHNRSTSQQSFLQGNYHPKLIQNIISYLKDKTT